MSFDAAPPQYSSSGTHTTQPCSGSHVSSGAQSWGGSKDPSSWHCSNPNEVHTLVQFGPLSRDPGPQPRPINVHRPSASSDALIGRERRAAPAVGQERITG